MAERKGSKKLGASAEATLRARAMKAKGTSSKGLDARPAIKGAEELAKAPVRGFLRAGKSAVHGIGAGALGVSSGIERALGKKTKADDTMRRAGAAGKESMRNAKLIFGREPKGEDISRKGYAKGGSTASKRADGCAVKGKTKGKFV
jgi:hypothetical protein